MTTSRRLATLPLLLIGLAAIAALALIPWVVQAQSQEVTPTAGAIGTNPPAQPTNLQASAAHDSVVLTWTASTDQTVTHYAILRRNPDTDASQVFHVIESNAGPETSYTDSSVAASSTYIYRAKAVSPTGVSQWSGYVQADTPAAPDPTPTSTPTSTPTPEDLRPTGLEVELVENRVTLSWTAPAEDAESVDGYEVLRRRPYEGEPTLATLVADTESTATTYTDATANEAGVRYIYRVKALRGSEVSLWSNFALIELPSDYEAPQEDVPATATTPGAPILSTLLLSSSGSIVLSWSEPADDGGSPVTGYRIEYSEDSGDTWQTLVEDTATTDTEYTHGGLEPETTLHYRVYAINEHGAGPPSDAVSATTLPAPKTKQAVVPKADVFLPQVQVTPIVLVKNTGQTDSGDYGLGVGGNSLRAQAFTTGANAAGYTLSSIGFSFGGIASTSTAGADLAVTLNGVDSDDNPDTALCTLTDPATFSGSGVQTFAAPTTDPCDTLEANKTYFAVVQRVANTATSTMSLDVTGNDTEDTGGADGWSIGDASYVVVTPGTAWVENADFNHQLAVMGYAINNPATGAPSISGVLEEDEVLTADTVSIADVDVLGTFSYQWLADGTAISGATSSTYTLTATEVGDAISLTVTFTDGAGNSESLTSAATHNVVADGATRKLLWVGTLTPADVGLSYIGFVDTISGSLSPTSFIDGSTTHAFETIEYKAGFGLAIVVRPGPGAEERVKWIIDAGGEFALFDAKHIDSTLGTPNVRSEWLSTFGNPGWSIGAEAVVYLLEDLNNFATGAPSISGVLQQDEVLTADTAGIADADGVGTFSYRWLADGTAISGATSSTYTLTASEVGDAISLTVTFTDDEGYSESLTSAATHEVVASGATRKLLWLGTLTPGDRGAGAVGVNTFTNVGSLNPFKFTYGSDTYEIDQIDFGPVPSSGLSFIMRPVPGADEDDYWIVDTGRDWLVSDDDASIHDDGTQLFMLWGAVAGDVEWTIGEEAVVYLLEVFNYPATGAPSISGTPRVGEELTADTSGISDDDGPDSPDYHYQWVLVDGMTEANIGSDSSTYTLKDSDADKRIRVDVTFTDGRSNSEGPLSSELTDTVAPSDLLVRNTTETIDAQKTLVADQPERAQAFTTDSYIAGYQLDSVGFHFTEIANTGTAGSQLEVTLRTEDGGNPGEVLCTLTDPATFSTSGLHTFKAPTSASDLCPTLTPDTTYFAVVERVTITSDVIRLTTTTSSTEHAGSAPGWSIEDDRHFYDSVNSAWTNVSSEAHLIEVKGEERDHITVPVEWALTPSGLTTGDKFRLMFITGTGIRRPNSSDIDDYNTYVQSQANASNAHSAIKPYNTWFRALASTSSVDARDNTRSRSMYTNAAIYWLDGAKVADSYGDLYDGTWDDEANPRNRSGTASTHREIYTGTSDNGRKSPQPLGGSHASVGKLNNSGSNENPLGSTTGYTTCCSDLPYYALSGVFVVPFTNAVPEFSADSATRTLPENSGAGVDVVGGVITATDSDRGDTLTYSLASSGDHASFEIDSSTGQISTKTGVTHSFDFESATKSYSVTVNVSDSKDAAGDADTVIDDTIAVTINLTNVNEAPVIDNTQPGISKEENATFVVAFTASDVDDSTMLSWSIESTADGGKFEVSDTTGVSTSLSFKNAPDFETPTDVGDTAMNNTYVLTMKVTDDGSPAMSDTHTYTVTVTNVNEAPVITNLLDTPNVPENSSGTILLMASDVDVPDTQTWSVESTDDWDKFQVASGFLPTLSFKDQPDFETPSQSGETDNEYVVTVKLTDSGGLSDTLTFTVTVTNVNEAPEITTNSGNSVILMEAENTATSEVIETFEADDVDASTTLTWSLQGADAGDFTITPNADGDGELKFRNVPDFENPAGSIDGNIYVLVVKVRDNGSPRQEDTIGVNVHVTDVNEAPVITTNSGNAVIFREAENTATTEVIETFEATDVDANTQLTWNLEGPDAGDFTITTNAQGQGELEFANVPDFETPAGSLGTDPNVYVFTVRVRDNGSPRKQDTIGINLHVTNVNEAPEITTTATTYTAFNVDENTATTAVIKTYEATDVDASTTLTWSLEGNDAGDFTITSTVNGTANLYFAASPNFENAADTGTNNVYDVTVRVRDNGSPRLQDTQGVAITVEDVNETPVISGVNSPEFEEIEYDATSPVLTVGTYRATDDEGDSVTWAVSGTDAGHFSINSTTGVLSFSIRPDFENPADLDDSNMIGGSNNMYEIVLEAEDDNAQGGKTGTKTGTFAVVVSVTNVDETPEITTDGTSHTEPSFVEIEYDAATADLNVVVYAARDEEDGTTGITWSLSGTDAGGFTISTDTATGMGTLTFRNRPNYEIAVDGDTDNDYEITVRASDTTGTTKTREMSVVVTVTDVNERPDIDENFNAPQTSYMEIEYDADTTMAGVLRDIHTFTATDYDAGDTIGWALVGTDAAHLEIDPTTGVLTFRQDNSFGQGPLPNFEHPRDDNADGSNTYSITVRATDDDASDPKSTEYAVVVTVTDVNEQPEFTGTPETAIALDEHDANDNYVVMDLADYDASDEEVGVTWSLTGTDRRDFAISADGVVTFAETPNYEAPEDSGGNNVYEFTVVATDVRSGSSRRNDSVAVTVTVGDVEEAGTLTVDNLSPAAGETVTFRLTDPDGSIDTTSMTWAIQSLVTGGSWASVSGVLTPASTTFPWTVDEDVTGKAVRAMVTYTDRRGSGKTAVSRQTAEVTADPIVNAPPRFRGDSSWSVEEGPAGGAVGAPTAATDRDNDALTYGIQPGQNAALFEIDPATGQVRLAQALDFETTPGPLFFYLTLHDGKGVDANNLEIADSSIDTTRSATIEVLDVEEDGVVTLSDDEPGVETAVTATLEDGDGGVTGEIWQWARSQNRQTGWTNISGATSASYTATQADADFFLRATVTYTDRRGAGKSAEAITAQRVFGENQRPTFPSTEDGQRSVPENTPAGADIGAPVAAVDPENGTLTYALSGTDPAAFTIVESTGLIRTSEALDFETKPSYSVTVEVHDGLDGLGNASTTVDDTQAVTITVENVEELGVVTLTTNAETILARVEVTAVLEDDDGVTSVAWQWARSPDGRTDWVNIQGATSAAYTPTLEEDRGSYIRATASYTDGHGPNKSAAQVSARVGDPPPVNSAPVFPATEDGLRSVAENAMGGTAIGDPVAATDLNAGDAAVNDPLAYSLLITGPDAASFSIDATTGQLRVVTGVMLDFEGKRTYRVTVQVSDGRDQNGDDDMEAIDDTQSVTITVMNVNEPPVVTGDTVLSFDENGSNAVESYTAADPERDTFTWSVSAPTNFWTSDRGQLYFRSPPSFEDQETYPVTVFASDGTLAGSLAVTVTISDVEEQGVVTISPPRGWVDDSTLFSAALSDDDGAISGTTWQWARSSNGRSSWADIASATSDSYTASANDLNQYLRASASYEDRRGSNKTAEAVLSTPVGDVRPAANTAPEFTETGPVTRTVREGTAAGRNIGSSVRATDADQGDVLTYSLQSGTDADAFDIDPATGQIRTKDVLDNGVKDTHTVTVSVHDGFDSAYNPSTASDATLDVTIMVTAAPVVVRRPPTGGGGGGGGGGGRSRATPTPTPSPTPTPTPTPTPIPTPTGPQYSGVIAAEPSVTATVVPEGTTLGLNGGGDQPGGVYVNFPPTAVALPVPVSVSVSNEAPDDVEAPSGTTLLPLTIDITPETPLTLGEPLTIEINPTPEQLEAAGGDLNHLSVGVVTPHGVVVLPAQVLHGRLVVTTDRIAPFVLVAITDPGPVLRQPPPGDASSMGPLLQWTQPPGTTWFQVQVIPFNEDGPGINLVIGDGALVSAAQYQVMAPNFGSADPNYVLLPDMTYLWRVRTSTALTNPTEADWSAWAASSFKTPPASSSTITRVAPPLYGEVRTLTPTLTWGNSDPAVFYYEVQLSRDFEFGPNAFRYSEYVHGGASSPANSYVVPAAFPLEAGAFYYWRVRPRIQGDGDPLPWSSTYVFEAPG